MSESVAQGALWLLVLLPALVGAVLALSRLERAATVVSITTAAATAALSVLVGLTRPQVSVPFLAGTDFAFGVDGLSALMAPMVAIVTALVLIFSIIEIRRARGRFHGLMLIFASAALLTATAQTLAVLLFAWEMMGATSFALIGFWWRDQQRVSSGLTAFLTTRTADLGMYLAAAAALASGAGLGLSDLSAGTSGWRHVVAAGLLVAALGKAAQLPFSFWLSRAMQGPSSVSALLHSAAMVAMGGYLLLHIAPVLSSTGWAGPATAWIGAGTAVLLGAVAVTQHDLKQLLAASTAAQLGFVVLAAGLGSVTGGAAHLVAHAATKALLFLVAGAWLIALGTKSLTGLSGVARHWKVAGWTATLGALSLAGVAPFALWATKDAVLAAALRESFWLYAAGLTGAALSAAYAGKILVVIRRTVPTSARAEVTSHYGEEERGTGGIGHVARLPLVVLAAGAAVLGLLALPPLGAVLARFLGEKPHSGTIVELVVSALLAALVVALVWWRPVPAPRWAVSWLGLQRATSAGVIRPTLALAQHLARFDDQVLDRAAEHGARGSLRLAGRFARFDDQVLDGVIEHSARGSVRLARGSAVIETAWFNRVPESVAALVRWLGRVARRPQSGQLHQYYIQAFAVIAIGVALLIAVR